MKKLLLSFLLSTFCLTAEEQDLRASPAAPEIQTIFEENYLNAEDTSDLLYLLAAKVIKETNSPLSPTELVDQFKQVATYPGIKEKYLDIYASQFNQEEAEEICKLIQDDIYLKYRKAIEMANWKCHEETLKLFNELTQTMHTCRSAAVVPQPILQATNENIQDILKSPSVVIDVYADWCGPCQYLAPVFNELNQEYGNLYKFVKLNAEHEESLTRQFQVQCFPTIIFIKNGKEVGRHTGFLSKDKLLAKIKYYLN